ncbi:phage tail tape measure protein [Rhizobium sp. ST-5]
MNLDVIVRMRDLLSGPLRRLRSSLEGITSFTRRLGLVAAAVTAISFMGPIQEAAAFQQKLLDIAGTQNLVGQQAFQSVEEMRRQYEDLANLVGLRTDDIASGAAQMIAAGLDKTLVDSTLPEIGKAAKAANASMADMAGVATSLLQTLKLPADQLDEMLAGLVVAGKEGAFELKDMAKYFPTLTGQMAKLGVTGREAGTQLAAMLQIARKGTADPAEAANNLNNFLSKITSPETRKNFEKMNVDIQGVMKNAALRGINPIEAVVQKISKLTGVTGEEINGLMEKAKANGLTGADALEQVRQQLEAIHGAGALGELFSDMQVMGFLIPMLANIDEYKRIRDEVAKATGAMTDGDFKTQMESLNTQMIIFENLRKQMSDEIGFAFGAWLPEINRHLTDAIFYLRQLDRETGGAVRQWLSIAAAGVLAATALGALGFALSAIGSGMAALAMPFMAAGRILFSIGRYFATAAKSAVGLQTALASMSGARFSGLSRISVGLRGMALAVPGLGLLKGAIAAIGVALAGITWPIWAAVAGIAGLGLVIYNYWEPIKNYVQGFASVVGGALGELTDKLSNLAGKFASGNAKMAGKFAAWLGFDEAEIAAMSARIESFADSVVGFIKAIPGKVKGFLSDIFTMNDYSADAEAAFRTAGEQAGQAMVNGIKGKFNEMVEWFRGLGQRILDAIGTIDITSRIKAAIPFWGDDDASAPPQAANDSMLPAQAPTQKLDVDAKTVVEVIGPAKVVESSTAVSSPSPNINTGRRIGRN